MRQHEKRLSDKKKEEDKDEGILEKKKIKKTRDKLCPTRNKAKFMRDDTNMRIKTRVVERNTLRISILLNVDWMWPQ